MGTNIFFNYVINTFYRFLKKRIRNIWFKKSKLSWIKKDIKNIFLPYLTRKENVLFILILSLWVQVPQWEDDWAKCAVDIPDSSCHWYVKSPDNTFGEGFDWDNAPLFDVNGLNDIAKVDKETVLEKLQKK